MIQYTLTGFSDEIAQDLTAQLKECKKLGISYIEMRNVNGKPLVDYSLEEVKEFKKTLDSHGIKVSAVGSPLGKISINDDFEPHYKKFLHTLDICKVLETRYIRLFSFFIPKGENPAKYRDEVIRRMKCFVFGAKDQDIILLHENEKEIYGDVPERCLDILTTIGSATLRGIFDPANFIQCGAETLSALEMLKPYIEYMHIKDCRKGSHIVVASGEGDGHIYELLSEMFKSGYKGFLSLEPHLNNGDISVGGAERFEYAFFALKKVLDRIKAEQ